MCTKQNRLSKLSLGLFLSLGIVACGGGGGGDGSAGGGGNGNGTKWGFVNVEEESDFLGVREVELSAGFFQYDINVPEDLIVASFGVPTLDVCEVVTLENNGGVISVDGEDISGEINVGGVPALPTLISAGQTIQFTEPVGGTFGELIKRDVFGNIIYDFEDAIAGSIPDGLVIDIPGDVFPAFSSVTTPNAAGLTTVSVTGGSGLITPDAVIIWDAGADPDAYIEISASEIKIDPDNFKATIISVDCNVIDDGSFSFPQVTKDKMGLNFSASGGTATRTATKVVQQNGAILIVNSSSKVTVE